MARTYAAILVASALATATSWAQLTQRVSLSNAGAQGNAESSRGFVSGDGRYVAFHSNATNLVAGDTNGAYDVFVRDRLTSTTERVSVSSAGAQGNSNSFAAAISPDGRWVVLEGFASNLVPGDTNGQLDVFVRDRVSGVTERVNVSSSGAQANDQSHGSVVSADGRFVAFTSFATNLVPGDTNIWSDIFVRDRVNGTLERISVGPGGVQANFANDDPTISADGRFVAFRSGASNLVPSDTNNAEDIFVRDRLLGTTERVSVATGGAQASFGASLSSISADGRYVAFDSSASNLVAHDTNGRTDVFVRDRLAGTTVRVSVGTGGVQGDDNCVDPSISADGRRVTFYGSATNLVPGDTNGAYDAFVRDLQLGTTERISVASDGSEALFGCYYPSISADGRYVAFESDSPNLVAGDTGLFYDIFVHDLAAAGFTSACEPGTAGVSACPCSNPPSGPGRGCDNSTANGGARLAASGNAYLAIDSLVLTTSGLPPNAACLLVQGDALDAAGAPFGQGLWCVGGTLRRLASRSASGGIVTTPDLAAGEATLSARSAARGDVIRPGESRWYALVYRDLAVLGGCPASSTSNVSQAGRVTWWP